jgi:putative oxidoreductase
MAPPFYHEALACRGRWRFNGPRVRLATFAARPELARHVLRVTVAILLGVHGVVRPLEGGVTGFGGFLSSRGFPYGVALAWAITLFEIVGSVCLTLGFWTRVVASGHILILLGGIALVHAPEGWFVVGRGRNGVEYSVLLITCLACVILSARPRT